MSALIVVSGPRGAGKSTVAPAVAHRFEPSAVIASDAFFAMVVQGYIDPWTAAARRQNEVVVAAAAAAGGRMTRGGYTVVFDGVIGPWFLEAFVAATGLPEVHLAVLLPPEAICLQRLKSRTGHGFADPDAARQMYQEFAQASTPPAHIIRSTEPPEVLATMLTDRFATGSLRLPVDQG